MSQNYAHRFDVHPGWKVILMDLGINPEEALRLAGLPLDLFNRENATVSPKEFFDFWQALEDIAQGRELPLEIGQILSVESFDPTTFACLCSPNMNVAIERLSHYKTLIGPLKLILDKDDKYTRIRIQVANTTSKTPRFFAATELVFLTKLIRLATRQNIKPTRIEVSSRLGQLETYTDYFGTIPLLSDVDAITFKASDAQQPFLIQSEAMWDFFEPELKKRLAQLEAGCSMAQKVRSTLMEQLPSGLCAIDDVAQKLGFTSRTLQRKLKTEEHSFQEILGELRHDLAKHYLKNTQMRLAEISFMLGFLDSNSFIRSFKKWTGITPGQFREQ